MLIDDTTAKEFFKIFLALSKETAIQAHNYLKTHNSIRGYCQYPVRHTFLKDDPLYTELFQKVSYFIFDIPKYHLTDFPKDSIQYG